MADKIAQGIVIALVLLFSIGITRVAWLIKTRQI